MRLGLSANTCGLLQSFPRIYLKKIMKTLYTTASLLPDSNHIPTYVISVRWITTVVIQLIKVTGSLTYVYQQNT
jgi:hypothetical protein